MPATDLHPFISARLQQAVSTGVDPGVPIHPQHDEASVRVWDDIEGRLIGWGCNPSQLAEEGTIVPSGETISIAIQQAANLSQGGRNPPPTRVVPDAHGGIVFELQGANKLESIHVRPDGSVEHRLFVNHRLVLRESWT